MRIAITSITNCRIPRRKIVKLLNFIGQGEKSPDWNVSIIFTDDKEISALNRRFRGKFGPTDILSFNFDDAPGRDSLLGEIYISAETAMSNAEKDEMSFTDEIILLCCHGMLHLFGYDHLKRTEQILMQNREKYYLEKMKRC
ncbi:MAG: rRNA maturation RNase YbeY [candidate division Zixibacteria bacterium]|nr:rRNA maturation RNase YbeY [candidate division Zixibacteria bacterium]